MFDYIYATNGEYNERYLGKTTFKFFALRQINSERNITSLSKQNLYACLSGIMTFKIPIMLIASTLFLKGKLRITC